MISVIWDLVERVDFNSYEDFYKNFKLKYEEDFNFWLDIVDKYAEIDPYKIALIWTKDNNEEHFHFQWDEKNSNKIANLFNSLYIKKSYSLMLTSKKRYEFCFCILQLYKIGVIYIPGTHNLNLHDIDLRLKKVNVKMVVSYGR